VEVFDCIEFSDALRWIDVINDLAFAWMDLTCRNRPDLAARLLNGYLARTGDYDGLALLAYYSAHRALVRCLALLLRAAQAALPAAADAARREALAYLSLAARLAVPGKPALLITHGFSGSGKTRFSEQAAALLGAVHVRSDIERKRLHGLQPGDRSGAAPGSPLYGAAATRRTYERLLALARTVVQAGMIALVDAAFLAPAQRRRFARYAAQSGVPFTIFDVRASPAVMAQRLALRAKAGVDASDADAAVLAQQLAAARPLSAAELERTIVVDTDASMSPGDVAALCKPLAQALGIGDAPQGAGGGFPERLEAAQDRATPSS
jgi:predicted kinase